MKIIEELFTQEFPSKTETIKFVDPIKKKISYFDLKNIGDPSYFDEPLFKAIEIPKELVLAIFKRGFDAAMRHFVGLIDESQKE
jgi:hypothetical protein